MVRLSPLRPAEDRFVCDFLKAGASHARALDLPAEEQQIWRELLETDAPGHITNSPDFQYRAIQTVFVGQTASLTAV